MVDVLMLASLGDTNLDELLALSQEYDVVKKERTQSFFSDRTIYDATAFTQTRGSGDETAYLGHVIVGPNGRLGFDPSVVLAGGVPGGSFHDFLAEQAGEHHDGASVLANLLAGDDVVVGNGFGSDIYGYDGNDVLLVSGISSNPNTQAFLHGGAGDDVLFSSDNRGLYGEAGVDSFVVDSRGAQYWFVADIERGVERIMLDRELYADVGSRVTKEKIAYGSQAVDADDRIIIEDYGAPGFWRVYIDPDGVGGQAQQFVGYIGADYRPTFRDFGMVDAAKLMPDISKLFDMGAHPTAGPRFDHAIGTDHATFAHDLAHHGLIQLV